MNANLFSARNLSQNAVSIVINVTELKQFVAANI